MCFHTCKHQTDTSGAEINEQIVMNVKTDLESVCVEKKVSNSCCVHVTQDYEPQASTIMKVFYLLTSVNSGNSKMEII